MKKTFNRKRWITSVLAAALAASMTMAMAITSFAFYQAPAGKKGILISGQEPEYLQDLSDLGIQQAICNIGTDQVIGAYGVLASYCKPKSRVISTQNVKRQEHPASPETAGHAR